MLLPKRKDLHNVLTRSKKIKSSYWFCQNKKQKYLLISFFLGFLSHSMHWGINPPSKTPPFLFCYAPIKSAHCPGPLFRQLIGYFLVFPETPVRN